MRWRRRYTVVTSSLSAIAHIEDEDVRNESCDIDLDRLGESHLFIALS